MFGGPIRVTTFPSASHVGSLNRDGEAKPGLVEKRDKDLQINSVQIRRDRQDLEKLAKRTQNGVDALNDKFKGPVKLIPGVVDKNAATRQR